MRVSLLTRTGGDLLSHVLRRSTIGATALNCRVRDGIGCFARAMTTNPRKKRYIGLRFDAQSVSIVYVFLVLIDLMSQILLLLDQIKPIEQLVPVS